ncbi:MAG: hypothetical protein INR62_10805 [Rhodospirillales bacterium]|nr:hypothetical protein [Acetobacter sp.]
MLLAALACVLLPATALAQKRSPEPAEGNSNRATVLHTANVYAIADSADPPLTTIVPGRELVINSRNGAWVNVFGNTDTKEENPDEKPEFTDPRAEGANPASGWIRDKGIVGPRTPQGDQLLFGAAAELEAKAAEPHAPKDAAPSAQLLYRRVWEYFPDSPLAPEAAFRSADIRWQIDKLDNSTLPSAHEQEAYLRPQLFEGELKRVIKFYPSSPDAARAAFDLIDNRLCGDWQGLPKCPEMETGLYLKYADRYPNGPKTAEALYNAVYRQGVLVTMYQVDENKHKADAAAQNCASLVARMQKDYAGSDFTQRAASIAYRVSQGISIYGSDRD